MDIEILRHPLVVYGGGTCLALQLFSAWCYRGFLRRYRRKTAALTNGGTTALMADDRAFGWFAWLRGRLRAHDTANPSPPDRTVALGELDWHLQASFWLAALQRLGFAAPLVGLLLTALGFFQFKPTTGVDGSDLGAVLRATLPLMLGVAVGACLALVNQFLLLLLLPAADRTRAAVRDWYDGISATAPGAGNPLVPVADALRTSVGAVERSVQQFASAAEGSKTATARLGEVATAQQRAAAQLTEQLGAQAALATELNRVVTAAGEAMTQLAARTTGAVASTETAARAQGQWAETGARAAAELGQSVADLRGQVELMRQAVAAQGQVVALWQNSVATDVAPTQAAFTGALTEFRAAASGLAEGVGSLGSAATAAAAQVQRLTGTTEAAVSQFGATVGMLASAVEGEFVPLARSLAPVQGVVERIADVGGPLAEAASAVAAAARQHHTTAEHLAPAYQELTATLTAASAVTDHLRQLQAATAPAVEAVSRSVDSLAEAARQIGALSAGGLEPMAARLAQIEQVLGTLTAVIGSVQPLTGTGELVAEIRRLGQTFDHMERATDQQRQIAELLRDLAESARSRPRRSFFGRLLGN